MKLIMVDLDGTLFDTSQVNYLAYREALAAYGYSLDYQYFRNFCNGRYYLDFLPQITTSDPAVLADLHERKKAAYSAYLQKAQLNTALADLLRTLKGAYKLALVTTASTQNTHELLKAFALEDLFDLILCREDFQRAKPAPDGYLKAMEAFGASPEDALIFEDSDAGIEAAERAGVQCLVVPSVKAGPRA